MIIKAALLLFRGDGENKQMLLVRSKGKTYFIFPGGKQEAGETIVDALHREIKEELQASAENPKEIGVITGTTPDGRILEEHLFTGKLQGNPLPSAEVEEMIWVTRKDALNNLELTPISVGQVFPFLQEEDIWQQAKIF